MAKLLVNFKLSYYLSSAFQFRYSKARRKDDGDKKQKDISYDYGKRWFGVSVKKGTQVYRYVCGNCKFA